ncbi:30S ribosomal protein S2 [Candidatus Saccharibacteria bacterium]|nr:30S ribosomal protein S2 [Candidatus Saccharibacteria bacterium]
MTAVSSDAKRTSFEVDIKKLLEAGAHFGHQTSRWHPKMAPYIHSKRGGSHVIDLTKTVEALDSALNFLSDTAAAGKQILLVSTKRQAKDKIKEVALATNMPYVTERWLGGMLTNYNTISVRIKYLVDLENRMASGELENRYSKLEVQHYGEEIEEMNHLYGGIKELHARPGAVFVVDMQNDEIAVKEARKLGVPVVGLTDTNVDPTIADYPIPCNDDATKTINLVLDYVQQAIADGQTKVKKTATDEKPEAAGAKIAAATKETDGKEQKTEKETVTAPVKGIG